MSQYTCCANDWYDGVTPGNSNCEEPATKSVELFDEETGRWFRVWLCDNHYKMYAQLADMGGDVAYRLRF